MEQYVIHGAVTEQYLKERLSYWQKNAIKYENRVSLDFFTTQVPPRKHLPRKLNLVFQLLRSYAMLCYKRLAKGLSITYLTDTIPRTLQSFLMA
jgi:hypothetical protein